jgi:outer membrane lipoprotein-sorting protein
MELKTWVWKEHGLPIRMERPITEGKVIIEWKGIEFGEIPDSMFELPPGVQIR